MKEIVLISGGSRGLGLAIATEWAKRGASLSLCARSADELQSAREKLLRFGRGDVATFVEDLTRPEGPRRWVMETLLRFGRIDVLVNNAGAMDVGPLANLSEETFRVALDSNLWSMIRVTLAALPHLSHNGRIVNITSIGAAVSVPHMLPHSVSKFGALGFSLGLEAELSDRGISVTSVLPGLMRTGSVVHARFRGDAPREFAWFSASAGLPILSISAESAAKRIVSASLRRKRFVVLGPAAKALRFAHMMFPNLTLAALRQINRLLLPAPKGLPEQRAIPGNELGAKHTAVNERKAPVPRRPRRTPRTRTKKVSLR